MDNKHNDDEKAGKPKPKPEQASNINKYKFNINNVSRGIRFLQGILKKSPSFMNKIGLEKFSLNGDKMLTYNSKTIVPEEDIEGVIRTYDESPIYSGGRDKLWFHISQKYIGISKVNVAKFIKNSEVHQLNSPRKLSKQVKSIVISKKATFWQIDLISFLKNKELNNNMTFALTIVDSHSKLCEAEALKNKEVLTVIKGINAIFDRLKPSWKPKTILADNGGEFDKTFENSMKRNHNIRVIHTNPYKPASNGGCERLNRTIKTNVFRTMTRYQSKRWVDLLPLVVKGINTTPHSTTKFTPLDIMNNQVSSQEVLANIKSKASANIVNDPKPLNLQVGDSVRVQDRTLAKHRKMELFSSKIGKNWSNKVYTVRKISVAKDFNREEILLTLGNRDLKKKYRISELMKIDLNLLNNDQKSIHERPVFNLNLHNRENQLVVQMPAQRRAMNAQPRGAIQAPAPQQARPVRNRRQADHGPVLSH